MRKRKSIEPRHPTSISWDPLGGVRRGQSPGGGVPQIFLRTHLVRLCLQDKKTETLLAQGLIFETETREAKKGNAQVQRGGNRLPLEVKFALVFLMGTLTYQAPPRFEVNAVTEEEKVPDDEDLGSCFGSAAPRERGRFCLLILSADEESLQRTGAWKRERTVDSTEGVQGREFRKSQEIYLKSPLPGAKQ